MTTHAGAPRDKERTTHDTGTADETMAAATTVPSPLTTKQKGTEAQAWGRGRRADATTSAGAARDGGRMMHATRTADETTDEATTATSTRKTKRKGTEAQAQRRGAADETEKTAEGEGEREDVPGYVPTPEDLRLREVYGTGFTGTWARPWVSSLNRDDTHGVLYHH